MPFEDSRSGAFPRLEELCELLNELLYYFVFRFPFCETPARRGRRSGNGRVVATHLPLIHRLTAEERFGHKFEERSPDSAGNAASRKDLAVFHSTVSVENFADNLG